MPALKNDRQENFCQEYQIDRNATAAADRAGYKKPNKYGPHLKQKPKVAARIAELAAEAAERNEVTMDSIARQLDEDRELAHQEGQASAAVQASVQKGKLFGVFDEPDGDDEGVNADAQIRHLARGNSFVEQSLRLILSGQVDEFLAIAQPRNATPRLVKDETA